MADLAIISLPVNHFIGAATDKKCVQNLWNLKRLGLKKIDATR